MVRRLAVGAASLTLILGIAACQPAGGAGGSESPAASAADSSGAPMAPTDAAEASPTATMGSDDGY